MSSKLKGCRPYGVTFGLFSYIFYSRYFKGLSIVSLKSGGKEKKGNTNFGFNLFFSRGLGCHQRVVVVRVGLARSQTCLWAVRS